jgi:hypothetical protein
MAAQLRTSLSKNVSKSASLQCIQIFKTIVQQRLDKEQKNTLRPIITSNDKEPQELVY